MQRRKEETIRRSSGAVPFRGPWELSGHGGNGETLLGEQLPSGLAGALLELWLR